MPKGMCVKHIPFFVASGILEHHHLVTETIGSGNTLTELL